MIAIAYLDGRRLSRAVIAGARFVADRAEPLNKINVFPVPDGDTGTNVAATLQTAAAGIAHVRQRHVRELSRTLDGSRRSVAGADQLDHLIGLRCAQLPMHFEQGLQLAGGAIRARSNWGKRATRARER